MAIAIRKFQEEREAWESERCQFEVRERTLTDQKSQVEDELVRLNDEIERLRSAQDQAAVAQPQGPVQPSAPMRSHHESQLALMTMIDNLRRDLRQEQERSRSLEQKASEAEKTTRRLSAELDRSREGVGDLDCTMRSVRSQQFGGKAYGDLECSVRSVRSPQVAGKAFMDLDCSVRSVGSRQLAGKASSGSAGSSEERDELSETLRTLQTSRNEVISLEDETLRLREELNNEKTKVIELKKAAHSRAAAWKEELRKITEELNAKQQLEQEVARCRKELSLLHEREAAARKKAASLQKELEGHAAGKMGAREEMELLSSVVGGQLVAVEQELTQQMKKSSQLFEHFLRHAHEPLTAVRRICKRIAASGAAGGSFFARSVPPHFDIDVHDLAANLSKIVDLLRFAAEVLEAQEQQQSASLPLHAPIRQTPEAAAREESQGFAVGWMRPFVS